MPATMTQELSDSVLRIADQMRGLQSQMEKSLRSYQVTEERMREQSIRLEENGMKLDAIEKSLTVLQSLLDYNTKQNAAILGALQNLTVSVGEICKKLDIKEGKRLEGSDLVGETFTPPQLSYEMEGSRSGLSNMEENRNGFKLPKVDFPSFDGSNPKEWLFRVGIFFDLYQIPSSQKIDIACIYMTGRACYWARGFLTVHPNADWETFAAAALSRRFSNTNDMQLMAEFTRLEQKGTVEEYFDKFEELRFTVMSSMPQATEEFYISVFMSGLKAEIQPMLKLMHPETLEQAYEQAVHVEENLLQQTKQYKAASKFQSWRDKSG